jgi:signal transduction histidine kinase
MIVALPLLCAVALWLLSGSAALSRVLRAGPHHTLSGTEVLRITLIGVLGLLIVCSAVVTARFARRLSGDISGMQASARQFSEEELPELVERLRHGDSITPPDRAPPPSLTKISEIAGVAAALAGMRQAAADAAAGEARLRNGISQVFVSLARRNQSLLQRQLRLIDELEHKAADPAALAELFPLDHLTTRMRRHAEGLIILSGAVPGRTWTKPVPAVDVIRAAVAEVEDYTRVALLTESPDAVAGPAVADVIHLLAELIENAALFSPSSTRVEVRAERVANGFAIEVDDRGLGIKPDELQAINERLASPPDFDLAGADRLGLFVVGKLAARHGIQVSLRRSPYGGTTAIVLLPPSTVVADTADQSVAQLGAGGLAGGGMIAASPPAAGSGDGQSRHAIAAALTAQPTARKAPAAPVPKQPGTPPGIAVTGSDPERPGPELPQRPGPELPQRAGPELPRRPSPEHPDPASAATHRGLPRRVRQASLSPHLRDKPAAATPRPEPGPRAPEEARGLAAAMQSGWQRGRSADPPDAEPGTAPQAARQDAPETAQGEEE